MAIVQISRITNRKGLQIDLPQLAGAELGWSIDERRLFIGNGSLAEGAPVIGNTEILTEFSDIFAFQTNYTYKGLAAGYQAQTGPTPSTPISQSLQSWLDQFATIKDFGAVGDGVTDDTAAINRALNQLYCIQNNTQIRRSLFFPAGVYRVTETILIPPYANLYGEGIDSSIIRLDNSLDDSTLNAYVARTADSLQQFGPNIGLNGASAPEFINISNLGFQNLDPTTDVFLVEDSTNCRFQNVGFYGALTAPFLTTDVVDTAGVRFASTTSLVTSQIVFDGCLFTATTFGINTDEQVNGITVTNSEFDLLYKGVVLGSGAVVNGGPTGCRFTSNLFDNIYAEGIVFGDVELNASAYNIFYDVGNDFAGTTNPSTAIINIQSDNNLSIGDLFQRTGVYADTVPQVNVNDTTSIGMQNSKRTNYGTMVVSSGITFGLNDNQSSSATIDTLGYPAFEFSYKIRRDVNYRTGVITVTFDPSGSNLTYTDDYTQNADTGITLTVTQVGSDVEISYTSNSLGFGGTLFYSIKRFDV